MKTRYICALLAIGLTAAAAQKPSEISATSFYTIMNVASKACIDDAGGSSSNGAVVQQWSCVAGNTNQQWMFTPTTDGYFRVATYNGKSLTWNVADRSISPGSKLQLWTYGGGLNEQFMPVKLPTENYKFVDRNSGLCLSVAGGAAKTGLQMQIDNCNGSASQAFTLMKQ